MDLRTAPPPADGRPLPFGNGGLNKALMPAQTGRLSPIKYRGREKDGNRKAMAVVRVRENARLSAPADGRVKREVYQHSAYAPVAQWIEHQPTDLGVGGSSPSGRTTQSPLQYTRYVVSSVLHPPAAVSYTNTIPIPTPPPLPAHLADTKKRISPRARLTLLNLTTGAR